MKTDLFKKSCRSVLIASSFIVLTACGGGGSDAAPVVEAEVGSSEWLAEQQATLDSLSTTLDPASAEGIAELQALLDADNAVEAIGEYVSYADACASGGVIDTAVEVACVQDIVDS